MSIKQIIKKILIRRKKRQICGSVTLIGKVYDQYFCDLSSSVSLIDGSKPADITLDDHVWMWGTLTSQSGGRIAMGKYSKIGANSHINAVESVVIGDYTAIAENVHISDNNNHPVSPSFRKYMRQQGADDSRLWKHSAHSPVVLGQNCWIGRNVSILKGVTIGDNSVIAANSVVTKSIPANCIAAGNPAKVVKTDIDQIEAPDSCEGYNRYNEK